MGTHYSSTNFSYITQPTTSAHPTFYNNPTITNITTNGIYSDDRIISTQFGLFSDKRIKKEINELQDDQCLIQLRQIKPSTYKYIDYLARETTETVVGFIAQEIKDIMPHAVSIGKDTVPNIFCDASFNSQTMTITMNKSFELETDGSGNIYKNLRLHDASDNLIMVEIEEVISSNTIKIKSSENVSSQIFVYGQEVDDFNYLDKNAIFTIATAALQEVDRQLQAEKAKTATLESQVAVLLTRVTALENA